MFKYKVLLFTLFAIISQAFAQKDPIKFGEVDEADVKATKYDKFPDAEAIVLFDHCTIGYDVGSSDWKIAAKYTMRIKILTKSGYNRANRTIPFYIKGGYGQSVFNVEGYTYNMENNKVVTSKLDKNAISQKMVAKNWGELKFSMPNVKEGSVIEYTYETRSDFLGNIPTWYFQLEIPVLWSELNVKIPQLFDFIRLFQGNRKFDIEETSVEKGKASSAIGFQDVSYSENLYRCVLKDIPPFKDEPFIASPDDHLLKMEFQLLATNYPSEGRKLRMDTWGKLIKDLLDDEKYGKYLNKNLPDKNLVTQLVAGKTTAKEKAIAIYEYVKNNIKYNGRTGIQTRRSIKEVLDKKVGNVSEINLLLVNMLREAGIDAYPVLSSTRWHGKIFKEYPIIDKFNYTLVYVNTGEEFLLDATEPMLTAGMIGYQALNGVGLLLKKSEKPNWVNLQASKAKNTNISIATLNMNKDGVIQGELNDRFGGYEAIRMRKIALQEKYAEDQEEEDAPSNKDSFNEPNDTLKKVNTYTFKNLKDLDKPLDGVKKIETSEFSQVNDNFIYFTPLLEYRLKTNPFRSSERSFDIDYACPVEKSFYLNFIVPEGYIVEEMPKPLRIKWQDESIKFEYVITAVDNKIQLVSKFILSRPIFKAEEYKALRDLYAQIVAKQEEQVVLKKK